MLQRIATVNTSILRAMEEQTSRYRTSIRASRPLNHKCRRHICTIRTRRSSPRIPAKRMATCKSHLRRSALSVRRRMWIRSSGLAATCSTSAVSNQVCRLPWDLPGARAMIFRCSPHSWLFRLLEFLNHHRRHRRIRNSPRGPTRARILFPLSNRGHKRRWEQNCIFFLYRALGRGQITVTTMQTRYSKRYSTHMKSYSIHIL
jgi:hypothetical protein